MKVRVCLPHVWIDSECTWMHLRIFVEAFGLPGNPAARLMLKKKVACKGHDLDLLKK